RSSARGVHDLKAFLEYARTGPQAIAARIEGSQGGFDSPLEEAIAEALGKRGWRIETQIGVSGFRIDLGVVHPDKPGAYLAGIECDGATYHRSAVARDRDKIREEVLTGLGWRIVRVWSTDWWYDSDCALEEIHIKLQAILEQDRSRPSVDSRSEDVAETECSTNAEIGNTRLPSDAADSTDESRPSDSSACSPLFARQSPTNDRCIYFRVNLGDAVANQDRFFDTEYADALRQMALAVLASQGPIRDDALVREIARAHGFARTGNRIKQRVLELLPDVASTVEPVGRFLWPDANVQDLLPFRHAAAGDERRSLDEIPMPELVGLVRELPVILMSEDPAIALAREIGLARLSQTGRSRLEEAISRASSEIP
ncbi:MAG: DUF3320 domain-containing protein, partial [Pirellulaceae bacterium]|nr:DUF3320 domain-containing protein [Pirellulaceae bacterium]